MLRFSGCTPVVQKKQKKGRFVRIALFFCLSG